MDYFRAKLESLSMRESDIDSIPSSVKLKKPLSKNRKKLSKASGESSSVNFKLDPVMNEMLHKSAKKCGRSKREEARLRLRDHLLRFGVLYYVDEVKER